VTEAVADFITNWALIPIGIIFCLAFFIDMFRGGGGRWGGSDRGGMDGDGDGGF
jgi:hypothetical protein